MRILIANRGEIARRIIRTAHRLGHETVAVYAEPDANAPHVGEATLSVAIGPASLDDSYLSIERLLAAADETKADAVHPGYGFLAESGEFAEACIDHGLIWIGPKPSVVSAMGSKVEARRIAETAGVPVVPGWSGTQSPTEMTKAAADVGFPILVKAAFGGGGKGIRIVERPEDLAEAVQQAAAEAEASFGDGSLIIERYIKRPRHIEVQIVGDKHGAIAELGTRECSIQRRYQKLFEEAPAPNLPSATRKGMRDASRKLAGAFGYDSAGTIEFIIDEETGDFYFLEMNTRLQVEHPVTEMITGLDLVEIMIRVATGERLPIDASTLRFEGHALEARILAEDAGAGFTPQVGTIHQLRVPDGVRWDSAIDEGSTVTPHYDSMIAKLVVHGRNRDQALTAMRTALDQLIIDGVTTTAGFHRWLLEQPAVIEGKVTTRFLEENTYVPPSEDVSTAAVAAAAIGWTVNDQQDTSRLSPWSGSSFALTPYESKRHLGLVDAEGEAFEVSLSDEDMQGRRLPPMAIDAQKRRIALNAGGTTYSFVMPGRAERWAPTVATRKGSGDALVAPFPGIVSEVLVAAGDAVEGDQVLVVIEAMKMLHSLRANGKGTIAEVRIKVGDQVAGDDVLVTFVQPESTG